MARQWMQLMVESEAEKNIFWRIFQIAGCIEQKQHARLLFSAGRCANPHAG
jgi:hypothetical protein